MIIGQTLMALDDGTLRYGDWVPRQGNACLASWEIVNNSGGLDTKLIVQTKNTEDADEAASELGALDSIPGPGQVALLVSGCLELVRYAYNIKGSPGDWVHLRGLPPSWLRS